MCKNIYPTTPLISVVRTYMSYYVVTSAVKQVVKVSTVFGVG